MVNTTPRILLLLGGTWHDFDGYDRTVGGLLRECGAKVETTYDLDALKKMDGFDVLLNYTCLCENREDGSPLARRFTDADAAPLADWVSRGGGLFMSHCATVGCESSPKLTDLAGGCFIKHPPMLTFTVYPSSIEHPITHRVGAFDVFDEFYIQRVSPDVPVHMVALLDGVAHPMLWTKSVGSGRMVNLAPGHDHRAWAVEPFQRLVRQSVDWLMKSEERAAR